MLLNIQLIIKSSFQCTFMAGTGMCLSVSGVRTRGAGGAIAPPPPVIRLGGQSPSDF